MNTSQSTTNHTWRWKGTCKFACVRCWREVRGAVDTTGHITQPVRVIAHPDNNAGGRRCHVEARVGRTQLVEAWGCIMRHCLAGL